MLIGVVLAVFGLITVQSPRGKWAMGGALIIGLLAGLEITWRQRNSRGR